MIAKCHTEQQQKAREGSWPTKKTVKREGFSSQGSCLQKQEAFRLGIAGCPQNSALKGSQCREKGLEGPPVTPKAAASGHWSKATSRYYQQMTVQTPSLPLQSSQRVPRQEKWQKRGKVSLWAARMCRVAMTEIGKARKRG